MTARSVRRRPFGTTSAGPDADRAVELLELDAGAGVTAALCTYGARLWSVRAPDRAGHVDELTLNLPDLAGLEARDVWFGATVGRYANRLGGPFDLGGRSVLPVPNEGATCLHGGPVGFDRRVWEVVDVDDRGDPSVVLALVSPDGDQGFPGRLDVRLTATLVGDALHLVHEATTDAATVVSLTNHAWWNLAGAAAGSVADHVLEVPASRAVAVGDDLVPTGELVPTGGTPLDLRRPRRVGDLLAAVPGGPDACLLPDGPPGERRRVARLEHPTSGRSLVVESDQPALQVYAAGGLDGAPGRDGPLARFGALCLEPQQLPDAPRHPAWPSPVLVPGATYRHHLVLRVGLAAGSPVAGLR